jgi:hypothetical protein
LDHNGPNDQMIARVGLYNEYCALPGRVVPKLKKIASSSARQREIIGDCHKSSCIMYRHTYTSCKFQSGTYLLETTRQVEGVTVRQLKERPHWDKGTSIRKVNSTRDHNSIMRYRCEPGSSTMLLSAKLAQHKHFHSITGTKETK